MNHLKQMSKYEQFVSRTETPIESVEIFELGFPVPKYSTMSILYVVRDRPFDFLGRGGGGGLCFSLKISRFSFYFLLIENQRFFFSHTVFRTKQKQFFFLNSIDLYVRVFLVPNIHRYIVYMFVYILDIGSECNVQ